MGTVGVSGNPGPSGGTSSQRNSQAFVGRFLGACGCAASDAAAAGALVEVAAGGSGRAVTVVCAGFLARAGLGLAVGAGSAVPSGASPALAGRWNGRTTAVVVFRSAVGAGCFGRSLAAAAPGLFAGGAGGASSQLNSQALGGRRRAFPSPAIASTLLVFAMPLHMERRGARGRHASYGRAVSRLRIRRHGPGPVVGHNHRSLSYPRHTAPLLCGAGRRTIAPTSCPVNIFCGARISPPPGGPGTAITSHAAGCPWEFGVGRTGRARKGMPTPRRPRMPGQPLRGRAR